MYYYSIVYARKSGIQHYMPNFKHKSKTKKLFPPELNGFKNYRMLLVECNDIAWILSYRYILHFPLYPIDVEYQYISNFLIFILLTMFQKMKYCINETIRYL